MKNGNITEFMDKLYSGEELNFIYDGKEYFLQGWTEEDGRSKMTLDVIEHKPFECYVWESEQNNIRNCADDFIKASIWEGKTFLQIEEEVFWLD